MHNAAIVARSLGCQCDTEMPTELEGHAFKLSYLLEQEQASSSSSTAAAGFNGLAAQ